MNKIPHLINTIKGQALYIIGLPIFFLCFVLLYEPRQMAGLLNMHNDMLSFNATIIMCIILGVMLLSRTVMLVLHKQLSMNWFQFIAWEVCELVTGSLFTSLYLTLMYDGEYAYFNMVGLNLLAVLLICIYPYIIFDVAMAFAGSKENEDAYDDSLMRFTDSTQRLKLIISPHAVLYISSEENYVHIHYMDNDIVKHYTLRSSMKSLEPLMQKHGMVRCQRSYYINPSHIKVLRKDKEGMIWAELDIINTKQIPVSAKYYHNVEQLL